MLNRSHMIRAYTRENESADILARNGYTVEQNPLVPGTKKKPDYRVEGTVFDNYAPTTSKARNIWTAVWDKVNQGQTRRVVINLNDSQVDVSALADQFAAWPIEGLEQVLVIRGESVTQLWP